MARSQPSLTMKNRTLNFLKIQNPSRFGVGRATGAGQNFSFLPPWSGPQKGKSAKRTPNGLVLRCFRWNRRARDLNRVKFWAGGVSRCRSYGAEKSKATVPLQRYRPERGYLTVAARGKPWKLGKLAGQTPFSQVKSAYRHCPHSMPVCESF